MCYPKDKPLPLDAVVKSITSILPSHCNIVCLNWHLFIWAANLVSMAQTSVYVRIPRCLFTPLCDRCGFSLLIISNSGDHMLHCLPICACVIVLVCISFLSLPGCVCVSIFVRVLLCLCVQLNPTAWQMWLLRERTWRHVKLPSQWTPSFFRLSMKNILLFTEGNSNYKKSMFYVLCPI